MIKDVKAELKKITALSETTFDWLLFVGGMAKEAVPGQFVSISCGEERLLRRPISICDAAPSDGLIRVVFEVRGGGTKWLSERKPGDVLSVLGPLGNGFGLKPLNGLPALFIAGGVGAPPIYFAVKRVHAGECDAVMGFRNIRTQSLWKKILKKVAKTVTICTDDGSYGVRGLVTSEAEKLLKSRELRRCIFACGPKAMLKAAAAAFRTVQYSLPSVA